MGMSTGMWVVAAVMMGVMLVTMGGMPGAPYAGTFGEVSPMAIPTLSPS